MTTRTEIEGVRDKLMVAVHSMAGSDAPIRARLRDAMVTVLSLQERDMPDEGLRAEFRDLVLRTTRVEVPRHEGTLGTTLDFMSDDDLREIAKRLCALHEGLVYAVDALDEE
jgi:hypothetical protein